MTITHVESPIAKYIRHVQMVAQGSTAPQIKPTSRTRIANKTAMKDCCAKRLINRNSGSRGGMSWAYTAGDMRYTYNRGFNNTTYPSEMNTDACKHRTSSSYYARAMLLD